MDLKLAGEQYAIATAEKNHTKALRIATFALVETIERHRKQTDATVERWQKRVERQLLAVAKP